MTDSSEVPRILTVDKDSRWQSALEKRLKVREIDYEQAYDTEQAIARLNAGDFSAVIMDGLQGGWRAIADEAEQLAVRPVLLSRSSVVIHGARALGIAAFLKNRPMTQEGIDPILRAALAPPAAEQPGAQGAITA